MEAVSTVEEGKEEANYDDDDWDDNAGSNSKVDEEELIKTKNLWTAVYKSKQVPL